MNTEPYKCDICNYNTFVKKNLLWHNSCESHLSRVRNIKPTALSLFNEIKIMSKMDKQDGKKITFKNGFIIGVEDVLFYKENKVFKSSLYEYLDDVFYKYKL